MIRLLFTSFFVLSIAAPSYAANWTWAGYEIIGYKTATRAEIASQIPIQVGTPYNQDMDEWRNTCDKIKTRFNFVWTNCTAVRYSDFKAYFIVDVVERGDGARIQFRPPPTEQIQLVDQETNSTYDALYARLWQLFDEGNPPYENHTKGYLDYTDPQMSEMTAELAAKVPAFHQDLLNVLANESDPNQRARAANLLNWDMHQKEDVIQSVVLLNDPDVGVRNNISRFVQAFVQYVTDSSDRKTLINSFAVQLTRPSHDDRNKALYCILNLLDAFPTDADYVRSTALAEIQVIAQQSILPNVKEPALQILKILKANDKD